MLDWQDIAVRSVIETMFPLGIGSLHEKSDVECGLCDNCDAISRGRQVQLSHFGDMLWVDGAAMLDTVPMIMARRFGKLDLPGMPLSGECEAAAREIPQ